MDLSNKRNPDEDQPDIFDENFGFRMLMKMGWEDGKVIGKNPLSYQTEVYEIKPRAAGVGLGAISEFERQKKEKEEKEQIAKSIIEKKKIYVVEGKHKGICGILKESNDNDQYIIEFNDTNLVVPKEWTSFDPPLQRTTTDPSNPKPIKEINGKREDPQLKWASSQLIVRIVSKRYREGKFYLKKATILETTIDKIIVILETGEILDDIKERYIETTMPNIEDNVMILAGEHRHCAGKLVKRDKKNNKVWVSIKKSSVILELSQGDCCAFEK